MTKVTTGFSIIRPDKAERNQRVDFKKVYFDLWGEAWQFHKEFADMTGTDEEWKKVIEVSEQIAKKYKGRPETEFVQNLLLTVIRELERVDKERRKEGVADGTHGKLEPVCEGDIGKAAGQA